MGTAIQGGENWWKAFGEVKIGDFRGGPDRRDLSLMTPEQLEVLKLKEFDEWVTYEDELVKLQYPKHPEIVFSVNKAEEEINVEGGVATTVDNRFDRAYTLKVGQGTYGVFLVNSAKWLDDGI